MKRLFLLLCIGLLSHGSIAQDIIVKNNGDEIQSKIAEITEETIKYKDFEFQDGPLRSIGISNVFMIIYENGKRENFSSEKEQSEKETGKKPFHGQYFMVGLGFGSSYGGAGTRLQYRWGDIKGYGVHAGIGYIDSNTLLFSVGFKYFPYKNNYVNLQFGSLGTESTDLLSNENDVIYGPSFLVGGDWNWGKNVGFGLNAGLGISYYINADTANVGPALDLAFIVRF